MLQINLVCANYPILLKALPSSDCVTGVLLQLHRQYVLSGFRGLSTSSYAYRFAKHKQKVVNLPKTVQDDSDIAKADTTKNIPHVVELLINKQRIANQLHHETSMKSASLALEMLSKKLSALEWDINAEMKKAEVCASNDVAEQEEESSSENIYNAHAKTVDEQSQDSGFDSLVEFIPKDRFIEEITLDESRQDIEEAPLHKMKRFNVHGTPDPSVPISDFPCMGCGARLHCQDVGIPGYLSSEIFKALNRSEQRKSICQRCFLMQHYNVCLNAHVDKDEYNRIISRIKSDREALIIVIVDLMDFPNSIIKDLPSLIGGQKQVFIIGNKVDLLPRDSGNYLDRIRHQLTDYCIEMGVKPTDRNFVSVSLVSAKTGFGIEGLISKLLANWDYKGDVFLLGMTNVGKSSLFNALLSSDYCRSHMREFINRATVSVWPGTTLNLLSFPILSAKGWRLAKRAERLKIQFKTLRKEEQVRKVRAEQSGNPKYLVPIGFIGQTDFRSQKTIVTMEYEESLVPFDTAMYSGSGRGDITYTPLLKHDMQKAELARRGGMPDVEMLMGKLTGSYWMYDTPGLINPEQIINQMTQEELSLALPKTLLKPRTILLKRSQVLFLSGMARIEFAQEVNAFVVLTVFASELLPIYVVPRDEADSFCQEHLGTEMLGIPLGNRERLDRLPSLIGREFMIKGIDLRTSTADIILSSLGWVAVTGPRNRKLMLRAYTPGGLGCCLRTPALLPYAVTHQAGLIKGTSKYRYKLRL